MLSRARWVRTDCSVGLGIVCGLFCSLLGTDLSAQGTRPVSPPQGQGVARPQAGQQPAPAVRSQGPAFVADNRPGTPGQPAQAIRPGQPIQSTPVGQPGQPAQPRPIQQPVGPQPPFTITPEHEAYLVKVLKSWEARSAKVQRYQCSFKRWEYDSVFGPKDPNSPKTFSTGVVKFADPDKGLFKVEKVSQYEPSKPGEPMKMKEIVNAPTEHWVCDGKSVFEFDAQKKLLIQRELPPELQGKAIVDGPMPFMFGAKAERMQQRYWLRVITEENVKDEYWIEAYPKTRHDAANFQKIWVVLDQKEFLPKMLQVFSPNFNVQTKNYTRTVYVFDNREVNPSMTPLLLSAFTREFYEPATPKGWQKQVEPAAGPAAQNPPGATPPGAPSTGNLARPVTPNTGTTAPPRRTDEVKQPATGGIGAIPRFR